MKRVDLALTVIVVAVGCLLIVNAGQPITPEAQIVGEWYDALCREEPDFDTLLRLTWRGDLTDEQLRDAIMHYRTSRQMAIRCVPVIDHDLIFFQWIPPELAATVERIKFVAVNVYPADAASEPNHILSIGAGVHVVFFKSGEVRLAAGFLGTPLTIGDSEMLYNNDGLPMGTARVRDPAIIVPEGNSTLVGVPVTLSPSRTWGSYTIRLFAEFVEAEAVNSPDDLPQPYRMGFIAAYGEGVSENSAQEGMVWFRLLNPLDHLQVSFEANQTPWDMRPLPTYTDVAVTP